MTASRPPEESRPFERQPRVLPPLVVLSGPTATGKTALSLELAEAIAEQGVAAEIISADSRQVYRGLDIGTAKVGPSERARIPHHGLDLVEPDQPFSVAHYLDHVMIALSSIAERAALAILVGGTGFYVRAVVRGLPMGELAHDPLVRAAVEDELAAAGLAAGAARLRQLAPRLADEVDLANPRRVARALELALLGRRGPRPRPAGYAAPVLWLGLTLAPVALRARIHKRAAAQFGGGLLEEAGRLRERFERDLPAFSAIGYREAWAVLDGRSSLAEAIELDAHRNVAFARRQRTWFRAEPEIDWLDRTDSGALDQALARLSSFLEHSDVGPALHAAAPPAGHS